MSDLVVFSHLRWTFVWQRPQHLISRLARNRRTWFIEEPLATDVSEPILRTEDHGHVRRVWLEVPGPERHLDFGDPAAVSYAHEVMTLVGDAPARVTWLYTPMAFELARVLDPAVLVYDVMDDLASFRAAPAALRLRHRQALEAATLVFAGGRSLHWAVTAQRPDAQLFPSGVEPEHYASGPRERSEADRPVAGYMGVIDERIDLGLLAKLAAALPDWEIRMVGPVVKVEPEALPSAANITYLGAQPYERLPDVLAGFDVALMPFALNEATRSISPTKTLEYFAAGLPVVSTRVSDVVTEYGHIVSLADDGRSFATACRRERRRDPEERRRRVDPLLRLQHWNAIASRMESLVNDALAGRSMRRVVGVLGA